MCLNPGPQNWDAELPAQSVPCPPPHPDDRLMEPAAHAVQKVGGGERPASPRQDRQRVFLFLFCFSMTLTLWKSAGQIFL